MRILSYEGFEKYLDEIKLRSEVDNEISDALSKLNDDFMSINCNTSMCSIIELLEFIFDDEGSNWISHWVFDLDFGAKALEYPIKTSLGGEHKTYYLETSKQLYDFLIQELKYEGKIT